MLCGLWVPVMKIVHFVAVGVLVMFLGFGTVSEAYSVSDVDRPLIFIFSSVLYIPQFKKCVLILK